MKTLKEIATYLIRVTDNPDTKIDFAGHSVTLWMHGKEPLESVTFYANDPDSMIDEKLNQARLLMGV